MRSTISCPSGSTSIGSSRSSFSRSRAMPGRPFCSRAAPASRRSAATGSSRRRRHGGVEAGGARPAGLDGPVIAAGSAAPMPSTAALVATIARLPHGAVVLPGLDMDLDESAWELIAGKHRDGREIVAPAVGHPQFAMQALLARLRIDRADVRVLGTPAPSARDRLVSHALCPASPSQCWRDRPPDAPVAAALSDVAVIDAGNAEEEALAIAVALREAVEGPKTRAALVTPDRALARRVVAALARWNVPVDDSGGDALSDTPAGV